MAPPMVYLHANYDSFSSICRISRPTTFVLVPYAYPAYKRQQRKAVHTSISFAFVVFINEMPEGGGGERDGGEGGRVGRGGRGRERTINLFCH